MTPVQSRMARAALAWSVGEAAIASGVRSQSIVDFEGGWSVTSAIPAALRVAYEAEGCRFLMSGEFKGAVVPPPPKPIEDRSGGNPLLPRR